MIKVLVICGPTGIGKSALALALARKYQGEIISGDSMQVYREMNIGTAKPSQQEQAEIPHHLLDIKSLDETFSVADFQCLVRKSIQAIHERGKLPILVGGTGLYIKAALYDYEFPPQVDDDEQFHSYSNEALYALLKEMDPLSASSIHPNNRKRMIRALCIASSDHGTKSDIASRQVHQPIYNLLCIGLTGDRDRVYARINARVNTMIQAGLEAEARSILSFPNLSLTARQAIGYKEFIPYFEQKATLEDVKETIKQASRRYAKRQFTWFHNQFDVMWFDAFDEDMEQKVQKEVEVFIRE